MSNVQSDSHGRFHRSVLFDDDWRREATEVNVAEVRRHDSPLDRSADLEEPWLWRLAGIATLVAAAGATFYYRAFLFS